MGAAGLPPTKLGSFLEMRVNDYLKRQSHPEAGEVAIRVVHVSDKVVEVKPGMKSRYGNAPTPGLTGRGTQHGEGDAAIGVLHPIKRVPSPKSESFGV